MNYLIPYEHYVTLESLMIETGVGWSVFGGDKVFYYHKDQDKNEVAKKISEDMGDVVIIPTEEGA